MNVFLVLLLVGAVALFLVLFLRLKRKENEQLVADILTVLSRRVAGAKVVDEPCVHETPIRCARIIGPQLTMNYSWPVGDAVYGRPDVISGVVDGTIAVGKSEFTYIEFEIGYVRAAEFPHKESMGYRIATKERSHPLKQVEGTIDEDTFARSTHLVSFMEITALMHTGA